MDRTRLYLRHLPQRAYLLLRLPWVTARASVVTGLATTTVDTVINLNVIPVTTLKMELNFVEVPVRVSAHLSDPIERALHPSGMCHSVLYTVD